MDNKKEVKEKNNSQKINQSFPLCPITKSLKNDVILSTSHLFNKHFNLSFKPPFSRRRRSDNVSVANVQPARTRAADGTWPCAGRFSLVWFWLRVSQMI